MKRILSVFLCVLFVFSLSSCKSDVTNNQENQTESPELVSSNESFKTGKDCFDSEDYMNAIENLNNVIPEDSNYAKAQELIAESKKYFKEEKIDEAQLKANDGEYLLAIESLNEINSVLPDDEEIVKLLSEYEDLYCSEVIQNAKDTYPDVATDWEKAIVIIKEAQQDFPDNELLKKEEERYLSYTPASLFDMHLFNNSKNFKLGTATDNMGNTYNNCMAHLHTGSTHNYWDGSNVTRPMTAEYLLERKYNVLSFTVAVEKGTEEENCTMTVEIHGDGRLLYSAGNLKQSTKPLKETVDVTGVENLKVSIKYDGPEAYIHDGRCAIFADPMLQKTK